MDIQEVKNAVKEIERIASNREAAEAAHIWEDNLWQEVLTSIAIGADNAQELAKEALRTKKIKFSRRCA